MEIMTFREAEYLKCCVLDKLSNPKEIARRLDVSVSWVGRLQRSARKKLLEHLKKQDLI